MPFKIKEARKEKGFTQGELAKRANVSRATIIGLENGSITVTTTETLTKIAGTSPYPSLPPTLIRQYLQDNGMR